MPTLLTLGREQQLAAVQLSHYVYTLLCIISQLMTSVDTLQSQLATCRAHGSDTGDSRKPQYRPNQQLEELRNLQDKLSAEKQQWHQVRDVEEKELEGRRLELLRLQVANIIMFFFLLFISYSSYFIVLIQHWLSYMLHILLQLNWVIDYWTSNAQKLLFNYKTLRVNTICIIFWAYNLSISKINNCQIIAVEVYYLYNLQWTLIINVILHSCMTFISIKMQAVFRRLHSSVVSVLV